MSEAPHSTAASSAGLVYKQLECGAKAARLLHGKGSLFRRKAFRDGVRRWGVPLSRLGGVCALQRQQPVDRSGAPGATKPRALAAAPAAQRRPGIVEAAPPEYAGAAPPACGVVTPCCLMADAGTTPAPDATDPDDDDAVCDAPRLAATGPRPRDLPPFLPRPRGRRFKLCHLSLSAQAHFFVYTMIVAAPAVPDVSRNAPSLWTASRNMQCAYYKHMRIGRQRERHPPRGNSTSSRSVARQQRDSAASALRNTSTLRVLELGPNPIKTRPSWAPRSFVGPPRLRWCDANPVTVEDRGSGRLLQ